MYDPNQQGYPQGGYPQGSYPQGGYPQGAYPQGGYPQGAYPQGGYPQGNYPAGGAQPYPPPQAGFVQPGYGAAQPGYGYDPEIGESEDVKGFGFSDQSIRRGFIRKVYSILMIQLVITFGMVFLFVKHEGVKQFVRHHMELFWVALVVMLVTMIAMVCCESVRRTAPTNFIFLGLFTAAEAFMLGVTATRYAEYEVLMAVGITAAVCLALTIFALQTKFDFTVCGGALLVILVIFMLFGLITIFIPRSQILSLVYASLGALIFSFYLIYDTQMMMGGNHKYSISPEEYIFAALNLYLDIVNIFIYILQIIGASRD